MPRFVANLTFLWSELPVLDRFAAAARAGFTHVEILFVHDLDREAVKRALEANHLQLHLFDPRAGDWAGGERGLLCLPGREAECLESIRDAVAHAQFFGTKLLNALVGIPPAGVSSGQAMATAAENLRAAAPLIEAAGLELLIENINTKDMPGFFASTPEIAARLVATAHSKSVRMQLDQYHCGMMGLDALEAYRANQAQIAHVQIADVPGRHQPGTGAQPIPAFLRTLDASGYEGRVGLEYKPEGTTEDSLRFLSMMALSSAST